METITFETLPTAVQSILDKLENLTLKFDALAPAPLDEDRFVDINQIRQLIFPQWKKQTIYNKCCLGEIPHSRIGARLLFNLKECREWRDQQLQKGKIKALSQIHDEAKVYFEANKNRFQ